MVSFILAVTLSFSLSLCFFTSHSYFGECMMVTVQLLNWLVWAALIGLNAVAEGEDAGVSSRADLGLGVMSVEGEKTSPEAC